MTIYGSSLLLMQCIAERVADGGSARPCVRAPSVCLPGSFTTRPAPRLFDQITELARVLPHPHRARHLAAHAGAIVARAGRPGDRLRLAELGAGSADKTRLLLAAASRRQGSVVYEPRRRLRHRPEAARDRIEREIPASRVAPAGRRLHRGLDLEPAPARRAPPGALHRLQHRQLRARRSRAVCCADVRAALRPGDAFLLGVDLVKDEPDTCSPPTTMPPESPPPSTSTCSSASTATSAPTSILEAFRPSRRLEPRPLRAWRCTSRAASPSASSCPSLDLDNRVSPGREHPHRKQLQVPPRASRSPAPVQPASRPTPPGPTRAAGSPSASATPSSHGCQPLQPQDFLYLPHSSAQIERPGLRRISAPGRILGSAFENRRNFGEEGGYTPLPPCFAPCSPQPERSEATDP